MIRNLWIDEIDLNYFLKLMKIGKSVKFKYNEKI